MQTVAGHYGETSEVGRRGGTTKYNRVVSVLSKPPSARSSVECNHIIPWFRKRSKLFASLKTGN